MAPKANLSSNCAQLRSQQLDANAASRHQLLAQLERQIRTHPLYAPTPASAPSDSDADSDDVDTYSSVHAEQEPQRSYLRMVQLRQEPASVAQHREQQQQRQAAQSLRVASQASGGGAGANSSAEVFAGDLLRNSALRGDQRQPLRRVRRQQDDAEDADDDDGGVWVDDDDDDDTGKQSASDLSETAADAEHQQPQEQQEPADQNQSRDGYDETLAALSPAASGMAAGSHGFELVPDEYSVYAGR